MHLCGVRIDMRKVPLLFLLFLAPIACFSQQFELSNQNFIGLSGGRIQWADLDGDNDLDIIQFGLIFSSATEGATNIFENINGKYTAKELHGIPGLRNGDIALADYDGDGDLDALISGLVSAKLTDTTALYLNTGNLTFTFSRSFAHSMNSTLSWKDIDNDKDLDIVIMGMDENSLAPNTFCYENLGSTKFVALENSGLPPCMQCSVDWSDYNQDGFVDVVLTGFFTSNTGSSAVYKNNGNKTFQKESTANLPDLYNGSARWGDYDNDGDLDILLNGQRSGESSYLFYIYENKAGEWINRKDISLLTPLTSTWEGSVQWVDIDQDGYLDIVASGRVGSNTEPVPSFNLYKNTHTKNYQQVQTDFLQAYMSSLAVADYDRDGDLDIAFMGIEPGNPFYITGIYDNTTLSTPTIATPVGIDAEILDNGRVKLSWRDMAVGETLYKINRSLFEDAGYAEIASLPANSVSFIDTTGFKTETYYYYTIHAENDTQRSDDTSLKVLLPAQPEIIPVPAINCMRIDLQWQDNSRYENGYALEWKASDSDVFLPVNILPPNTTRYTFTGLQPGTRYSFRIRAQNDYGYSASSEEVSIETNTLPTAAAFDKEGSEDLPIHFADTDFKNVFLGNDDGEKLQFILVSKLAARGALFLRNKVIIAGQRIATTDLNDIRYQPNANINGNDSFFYRPHDGRDSSSQAYEVRLTILAVNDPPILSPIADVEFQNATSVSLSFSVTDIDNDITQVSVMASSANPGVVKSEDLFVLGTNVAKLLSFKVGPANIGSTVITITASDGAVTTTESFTLTLKDKTSARAITVQPNPVESFLYMDTGGVTLNYPASVEVMDTSGNVLKTIVQSSTDPLVVDGLASGLYILRFVDANNGNSFVRFMKK